MKRIKLSRNLYLDEYIPRQLYEKYKGREHLLINALDPRLIVADQALRDEFGPVIINNWWGGGDRNWSGLRTPGSPYFSQLSQHTFGRASDKIFTRHDANQVREYIDTFWRELGISAIELGVSWVHSDVRYNIIGNLIKFNP